MDERVKRQQGGVDGQFVVRDPGMVSDIGDLTAQMVQGASDEVQLCEVGCR